jgi:hypothetical protein
VERVVLNALATNAILPPSIAPSAISLPSVRAGLAYSGEADQPLPYCAYFETLFSGQQEKPGNYSQTQKRPAEPTTDKKRRIVKKIQKP